MKTHHKKTLWPARNLISWLGYVHILTILVVALSPCLAYANNIPLKLQVLPSDDRLLVGDTVVLHVKATSAVEGDIDVDVPKIRGLKQIGRSQSSQMSMSFGPGGQRIERITNMSLEYEVRRSGTITVPQFKATVGRHTVASNAFELKSGERKPIDPASAASVVGPKGTEPYLFTRYRADPSEVWLGEQISLDFEIYVEASRENPSFEMLPNPPELDGFWTETLYNPRRLKERTEVIDGEPYRAFLVWRVGVIPLQAGDKIIPSIKSAFRVGQRGFFNQGQRLSRSTVPIQIKVKPLPAQGKPKAFVPGNIGELNFKVKTDRKKVEAGKAVLLTLTLSGKGHIAGTQLPKVENIPGFRIFPPSIKDDIKKERQGISGSKTAEILLIPQRTGRLTIPRISFSYFDTKLGRYKTVSSRPIRIQVHGDVGKLDSAKLQVNQEEPDQTSNDNKPSLKPLRYSSTFSTPSPMPWTSNLWLFSATTPPLLALLWVLATYVQHNKPAVSDRQKSRQNIRNAKEKLKSICEEPHKDNITHVASQFYASIVVLLSERGQVTLSGATNEQISSTLQKISSDQDLVQRLHQALETAQFVRFAPSGYSNNEQQLAQNWVSLFDEIETKTSEVIS